MSDATYGGLRRLAPVTLDQLARTARYDCGCDTEYLTEPPCPSCLALAALRIHATAVQQLDALRGVAQVLDELHACSPNDVLPIAASYVRAHTNTTALGVPGESRSTATSCPTSDGPDPRDATPAHIETTTLELAADACWCAPGPICVHRVAAEALRERRRADRLSVRLDDIDRECDERVAAVERELGDRTEDARRLLEALRDMVQDFAGDDDYGLRHASEREIACVARARAALRGQPAVDGSAR